MLITHESVSTGDMTKSTRLLLIAFAVLLTMGAYLYRALPDCFLHPEACFTDTNLAPYRYRVLQGILERPFAPDNNQISLLTADFILHSAFTMLAYFGLYKWFRRWMDDTRTLLGIYIFTGIVLLAFNFYFRWFYSMAELALVVWSLILIEDALLWQILIVIVASLNRETAIIIPALFLAYHWTVPKLKQSVILATVWVGVTVMLHIALGGAPHVLGLDGTFEQNIHNIGNVTVTAIILTPLAALVLMQYKHLPVLFQRFIWVAGVYFVACLVGGAWMEMPRLLFPVLPLLLPVLLYNEGK